MSRCARSSDLDVDGAVGAFGQGFAQRGGDALRPGAEGDHLAAILFLQLQRLFQRVGVRLVDAIGEVAFVDTLAAGRQGELGRRAPAPA